MAEMDEIIGAEADKATRTETQRIADQQGATRERAMQMIGVALNAGLRRKNPDYNIGLRGADMALKIHDAYPSEKHEHLHEFGNSMQVAVQVFQNRRKPPNSGAASSPEHSKEPGVFMSPPASED